MAKKYKFTPIGSRIVVRRDAAEEVSPGGIVLPEHSQDKPRFGTVIAVGPGRLLDNGQYGPMQVKVKDRVLLTQYAETVLLDGTEYVLAREDDILAIVENA